jgi:hypothetical protein
MDGGGKRAWKSCLNKRHVIVFSKNWHFLIVLRAE